MTEHNRISILEDTLEIQRMIESALTEAGYEVRAFGRASDFGTAFKGMGEPQTQHGVGFEFNGRRGQFTCRA